MDQAGPMPEQPSDGPVRSVEPSTLIAILMASLVIGAVFWGLFIRPNDDSAPTPTSTGPEWHYTGKRCDNPNRDVSLPVVVDGKYIGQCRVGGFLWAYS